MARSGVWQALTRERPDHQWASFAPFLAAGIFILGGILFRAQRAGYDGFFFAGAGLLLATGITSLGLRASRPKVARSLGSIVAAAIVLGFGLNVMWTMLHNRQPGVASALLVPTVMLFVVGGIAILNAVRLYRGERQVGSSPTAVAASAVFGVVLTTAVFIEVLFTHEDDFIRVAGAMLAAALVVLVLAVLRYRGVIGTSNQ